MLVSIALMWGSGFFFIELALEDFATSWIVFPFAVVGGFFGCLDAPDRACAAAVG